MLGSLRIGRILGIDIRLHWTFVALVAVVIATAGGAGPVAAALGLTALFGSVLLHELGHSVVAMRYGVRVLDITFWPLGGMARMSDIPEVPRIEGAIAAAGPAVNFGLAAVAVPLAALALALGGEGLALALGAFAGMNLLLGGFNLLPAFPMDGGRILRAWLARRRDYVRATELAVRAGRVVAAGMLVVALAAGPLQPALCMLSFIALFVWLAGGRELLAVRVRHGRSPFGGLGGLGVPGAARAGEPTAAWAAPPPPAPPPPAPAGDGDEAGARRPDAWSVDLPRSRPGGGGFRDEDLRALERYRGRLRG